MFLRGTENELLRAESNLAPVGQGHLSSYRGLDWLELQVPLNLLFNIQLFSLANANIQSFSFPTYAAMPKALPLTQGARARWTKHSVVLNNKG